MNSSFHYMERTIRSILHRPRSVMHCDKHDSERLHDVFHDWIFMLKKEGLLFSLIY
jgi:hypothetical protein